MMATDAPFELRGMFNPAYYRRVADLTLIQRMRRATAATHATLPNNFPKAVVILKRIAPCLPSSFT